jgi:hypothetical protein
MADFREKEKELPNPIFYLFVVMVSLLITWMDNPLRYQDFSPHSVSLPESHYRRELKLPPTITTPIPSSAPGLPNATSQPNP